MNARSAIVPGILALAAAVTAVALVRTPHASSVSPFGKAEEPETRSKSVKAVSADSRAPEYYGENVRSALFARPLPPAGVSAPAQKSASPLDPAEGRRIDPPALDLFAEVVYTGTVTIEGQKQALLENPRTKEGEYLQQGDKFLGATVAQVDDSAVTLNVNGQMRRIPKSNAYNLTPLNAQANSRTDKNSSDRRVSYDSTSGALAARNDFQAVYQAQSLLESFSQNRVQATLTFGDDTNQSPSNLVILAEPSVDAGNL